MLKIGRVLKKNITSSYNVLKNCWCVWNTAFLCVCACMQGEFGPFNPSMHSQVPLWLAVSLKQRQKCRIQPPDWLNVGE